MRIQGISRRKIGTDGHGVTDLVAMASCPLSCRYCLNKKVLAEHPVQEVTPTELLGKVAQEMCYFLATDGGVAFGGGEPLLQWKEILEFATAVKPDWMRVTIETALQAPAEAVSALLPVTDFWLVDIKTLDPSLYADYTGGSLSVALSNLKLLLPVAGRVRVRVPVIPGYKTKEAADSEATEIRRMGFSDIDVFDYVIR